VYYDQNGKPDPNGPCKLIDGRLCLREGGRIGFDVMLMDGKAAATPEAKKAFVDHYMGADATGWNEAQIAASYSLLTRPGAVLPKPFKDAATKPATSPDWGRHMRDAALAAATLPASPASVRADVAYHRSCSSMNDWRSEIRDGARSARAEG
jgi:hypothetical protein